MSVEVRQDRNLAADEVEGEGEEEFDVCTTCSPICYDQLLRDVEMPCYTRLNDVPFIARYHYDEERNLHRCRKL